MNAAPALVVALGCCACCPAAAIRLLTPYRHAVTSARRSPAVVGSAAATANLSSSDGDRAIAAAFELFDKFNTAFTAFDLDGDGTITVDELVSATRKAGRPVAEDEISALVSEYDLNKNGTIDFDEFCELMTRQAPAGSEGAGASIESVRAAAVQTVEARRQPQTTGRPASPSPQCLERRWWRSDEGVHSAAIA